MCLQARPQFNVKCNKLKVPRVCSPLSSGSRTIVARPRPPAPPSSAWSQGSPVRSTSTSHSAQRRDETATNCFSVSCTSFATFNTSLILACVTAFYSKIDVFLFSQNGLGRCVSLLTDIQQTMSENTLSLAKQIQSN